MSGMASITGFPGGPPVRAAVPWVDYSTALSAALGTMFALYHHQKTGEGQMVDVCLLHTAIAFMAGAIGEYEVMGRERYQLGNRGLYIGPGDIFRARDGWVVIVASTNALWRRLCRLLGRPELIDDPRLQTDMARFENREWIDPLVSQWVARRTVAQVVEELEKARLPCGPVYSIRQVARDPQVQACEMLTEVDFPGVGKVPVQSPHIRLSRTPGSVDAPAPVLGEHNGEVYRRLLGYTEEQLARLKEEGIV
jgi:CoA:oxalate CoA-transferase